MGQRYRNLIGRITSPATMQEAYRLTARGKRLSGGYLDFKEYDALNLAELGELQIDFIERIEIGFEIERALGLPFDTIDEATDATWKTVADVVAAAEKLARQYAAPADRGRAA